ncbi:MAG: sulfite exporter TauE/SafE family protein [Lysobacteraceae bacterium]|nr:MAG: sulfite exporter TauE/SafE family protein [Xanthomonadaceae bacterium]
MSYLIICSVALLASALTFFSGFGLGTLLLPAFALFFPVEQAVALTAVVHLLNSLFKLVLTGRHADLRVILRFGLPAIVMSFAGARVLVWLAHIAPVYTYPAFGRMVSVTPVNLVVGLLLLAFAALELLPRFRNLTFGSRYMPLGGLLSGFFGGLSGMQGALRSAFLARAGLTKEAFIATGVVIACFIDLSRIAVYSTALVRESAGFDYGLLAAAVLAAFAGAALGNGYLKKMTMPGIQRIVAVMLFFVALGLVTGLL